MAGRKPLTLGHLDELDASPRAKERAKVFLETLSGRLSVPEALARLGLSESYFHELRGDWLRRAVALLEPQPAGRPPRPVDAAQLAEDLARATQERDALRDQLRATQAQLDVRRILAAPAADDDVKKNAPAPLNRWRPK